MRANSREDNLLSKLKNCVGPISESTGTKEPVYRETVVSPPQMFSPRTPVQNCRQEVRPEHNQYSGYYRQEREQERRKIQLSEQPERTSYSAQKCMDFGSSTKQKCENSLMPKMNL